MKIIKIKYRNILEIKIKEMLYYNDAKLLKLSNKN